MKTNEHHCFEASSIIGITQVLKGFSTSHKPVKPLKLIILELWDPPPPPLLAARIGISLVFKGFEIKMLLFQMF